jgi:hypothetical protein
MRIQLPGSHFSIFVRRRFLGNLSFRSVPTPACKNCESDCPLSTSLKHPNLVSVNRGGYLAAQPINHPPRGSTASRHLERTRDRQPKWRHSNISDAIPIHSGDGLPSTGFLIGRIELPYCIVLHELNGMLSCVVHAIQLGVHIQGEILLNAINSRTTSVSSTAL